MYGRKRKAEIFSDGFQAVTIKMVANWIFSSSSESIIQMEIPFHHVIEQIECTISICIKLLTCTWVGPVQSITGSSHLFLHLSNENWLLMNSNFRFFLQFEVDAIRVFVWHNICAWYSFSFCFQIKCTVRVFYSYKLWFLYFFKIQHKNG